MTESNRKILAAQGYVELGLYNEARRELHSLDRDQFDRAEVIELGLQCLLGEQRWSEALAMAHALCGAAPAESSGYIHAAYCLHEMKRTDEAVRVLRDGPKSLHEKPVFYYNLACYNARLGQVADALKLLDQAFKMDPRLRRLARKDPDLQGLPAHFV
jgi:predicted Zn-dependent protease